MLCLFLRVQGQEKKPTDTTKKAPKQKLQDTTFHLQEVQVNTGYYKVGKRGLTGSIAKIEGESIAQLGAANPLAALAAAVPGLLVTQQTGVTGAAFKVQLRGQNSISQGNDPFFIIDGIPFVPNNTSVSQLTSALGAGGLSPFSTINPADIERIEILKDADATAIYGSRGANGVIIITTKAGSGGTTRYSLQAATGMGRALPSMDWMNTRDYVEMRKEAFKNDGITMTNANAYDILVWDTLRYTNWKKELIGGTANFSDIQMGIDGGTALLKFRLNVANRSDGTVYPGNYNNNRKAVQVNIIQTSKDDKLNLTLKAAYSNNQNNMATTDFTAYLRTAPNLPLPYGEDGKLNWTAGGYSFDNPFAQLERSYTANTQNLMLNGSLSYKLAKGFIFSVNGGFNGFMVNEKSTYPLSSYNPQGSATGSAFFAAKNSKGYIAEPQLSYQAAFMKGTLNMLMGASYQSTTDEGTYVNGTGYKNDALIGSLAGATAHSASNSFSEYKYLGIYGRLGYNYQSRYYLNLTGRRDGSSRFGPGKQFSNFYAIGTAWVFSDYAVFKEYLSFINFGKLRASYGLTGNDNIGNYQYLDLYRSTSQPYAGVAGIYPTKLANPNYGWETNKKLELAAELSLLGNKLDLTVAWFRNRSGNQLLYYALPSQTGFDQLIANLPALVENRGLEVSAEIKWVKGKSISLNSTFGITLPRNSLVSYPGLETSSYRNTYEIGKSLYAVRGFRLAGNVDPNTGLYSYGLANGSYSSSPAYPLDVVRGVAELGARFYGNFKQDFSYKGFLISVLLDFRKQTGYSYLYTRLTDPVPGMINFNQPEAVRARWQSSGDQTPIQKYTQSYSSPAYLAFSNSLYYGASNLFTDASFIRIKNVYLSHDVDGKSSILKKTGIKGLKIYLQANNLYTISNYYGMDPETQVLALPPLRTFAMGIHVKI